MFPSEEILWLLDAARHLMYPGMDTSSVYDEEFLYLNRELYLRTVRLHDSSIRCSTVEEESLLCLALLLAYNATFINHGDRRERVQRVLDRSCSILDHLPPSLLKLRLLTACYGEVYEEKLASEAEAIIASWDEAMLTEEQRWAIEEFRNIRENPSLWEYVGEE